MSIKNNIQNILYSVLKTDPYNLKLSDIILDEPKNLEYGDYATNVALRLTKTLKKAPKLIAQEIVEKLQKETQQFTFNEINGFINIKITDQALFTEVLAIKNNYGSNQAEKSEKILLEYVSANPTGPLHIGHGRWAVIGDIVSRVLAFYGYQVSREFYINDAGNQIANFYNSVNAVKNNQPIPEDGYHGAYIKELAQSSQDPVQTMLNHQREIMQSISVVFDQWFSEKTLHNSGAIDKALDVLRKHGAVYEQAGAVWFRTTDYGDDKDRVLIRSNGEKTYFTADIAYHLNKIERGFDQLINIWGADHHGYIPRVQAALKALTGKTETNLHVILGQLVNLFRNGEPVRMSKRTGEMITLEEVIQEIGKDATRYFLAMRSFDTALDFDLELAKKKTNDNPVYYVQYAHARICSILRQNEATIQKTPRLIKLEPSERALLLKLVRLPEELEVISRTYGIHRLCTFAEELAKLFHAFYHDCRVLSDDQQLTANRLAIVHSVRTILGIIFNLLGVSTPEKM